MHQLNGHGTHGSGKTHPQLVHFLVRIPKDQVVRSEMEGADVGPAQLGTDDPLDLFRNSRRNEDSDGRRDREPHMRSEANLCDSNFVHVGAAMRAGIPLARLFQINSRLGVSDSTQTSRERQLHCRGKDFCHSQSLSGDYASKHYIDEIKGNSSPFRKTKGVDTRKKLRRVLEALPD